MSDQARRRIVAPDVRVVGSSIIIVLLATALFALKSGSGKSIIPFGSALAFVLQVFIPLVVFCLCLGRRGYLDAFSGLLFADILFLFVLSLVSAFWSSEPGLVLQRTFMVFVPALLLSLLIAFDSDSLRTFRRFSIWFVLLVASLSVISIVLYIFGSPTVIDGFRVQVFAVGPFEISQRVMGSEPFMRVSSLLGNPNTLALWICMALPLALYLREVARPGFPLTTAILCMLAALIITWSRAGAFTALLIAYVFFGLAAKTPLRRWGIRALGILVVGSGLIFIANIEDITGARADGLNGRDEAWSVLLASILRHPLGVGFGVSTEVLLLPAGLEIAGHNAYLQIASELGVLGFGAFFVLILLPVLVLAARVRFSKVDLELRSAIAAAVSFCVGFLFHQIFEGNFLRVDLLTLFWVYVAFSALRFSSARMRVHAA